MNKPYQNDLDFLRKELEHYGYIAAKAAQEHDIVRAEEFNSICMEIKMSLQTVKKRQEAVVLEYNSLPICKRYFLLRPLFQALEELSAKLTEADCPETARCLEHYISTVLIDLLYSDF